MKPPVIVIGAGGHGMVVADTLASAGHEVLGFVDANPAKANTRVAGLPVLGTDSALSTFQQGAVQLANGIGSTGVPKLRRDVFMRLQTAGWTFATVIHPRASVSRSAKIETGAQIMAGAVVQAGAVIGVNCIINSGAIVDHDCEIGAHSHIAPGAVLSGGVRVGEMSHIGTGATIIEQRQLGASTLVAAGAVVVRDGGPGEVLLGVPARPRGRT